MRYSQIGCFVAHSSCGRESNNYNNKNKCILLLAYGVASFGHDPNIPLNFLWKLQHAYAVVLTSYTTETLVTISLFFSATTLVTNLWLCVRFIKLHKHTVPANFSFHKNIFCQEEGKNFFLQLFFNNCI